MKPIQHAKQFQTEHEFITQYIDLFTALGVEYKFQLSRSEKEFFVRCVLSYSNGFELSDPRVMQEFQAHYQHTKDPEQSVYQYRLKLKKKKWLIDDVPLLHFRNVPKPWNLNFVLNFSHATRSTRSLQEVG